MQSKGPYIAVACFCEHVLQEQDGVLSAIRIVDRVHKIEGAKLPANLPDNAAHLITMLINLKAGDFIGKGEIEIRVTPPSGGNAVLRGAEKIPVEFEPGKGFNLILKTGIPITEDGIYWYDVLFDNRLLTRVPMSVSVSEKQNATPKSASRRPTLSRKK